MSKVVVAGSEATPNKCLGGPFMQAYIESCPDEVELTSCGSVISCHTGSVIPILEAISGLRRTDISLEKSNGVL
jgi:hypothetical protein